MNLERISVTYVFLIYPKDIYSIKNKNDILIEAEEIAAIGVVNSVLRQIVSRTDDFLAKKPKKERKAYGQFFTSADTARYMVSLFDMPQKEHLLVLDPGAGSGILSAALIERIDQISDVIKTVHLVCYETNEDIYQLLSENLKFIKTKAHVNIEYEIRKDNYILSQEDDFKHSMFSVVAPQKYDLIIANPPYFKLSKDAPEAKAMSELCYGAPNIYFLFAGMSLFNLVENGQMVYIIPRSWTSGAYFSHFRKYLLSNGHLANIHLFVSRSKVFDKEDVLQETIIIRVIKDDKKHNYVKITSSPTSKNFKDIISLDAPIDVVISGSERYVYLVTTQEEIDVLLTVNSLGKSLPEIGLKMKTGLTVDFRNRELLRAEPEQNTIPLFYSQHIKNGIVDFPIGKDYEYLTDALPGLVQQNKNYLFVKRFTAKEERRRLQCGVYIASRFPEYNLISTQNKINFIDTIDKSIMSEELVFGLYTVLNSTIYDMYYRILNGSTQVNSTEMNTIPFPSRQQLEQLGCRLMDANDYTTARCDMILEETINA